MSPVAICICTCNRTPLLERVLRVLEAIDMGELGADGLFVVVIDNHPDGRVRALCDALRPRLPMPLHLVEEPRRGISYARNRAVREALDRGAGAIAFIDDDDLPRPDWLLQLLRTQRQSGADLVFGFWNLPSDLPLPRWLHNTRYFRPPRREDRNRFGLPGWAGTYNVLISRRALETLRGPDGPFRAEFAHCGGEDSDLFIRAVRAGLSHASAYDSIVLRVWESHRLTLRGILQRGFQRGGSRVHIAKAHLPDEQVRGLVWASWRKLGKALLRLPLAGLGRSRFVGSLLTLAHSLGEIYAWTGMRYSFYLRRRG
jgi:GT2 family glycosyltransferase